MLSRFTRISSGGRRGPCRIELFFVVGFVVLVVSLSLSVPSGSPLGPYLAATGKTPKTPQHTIQGPTIRMSVCAPPAPPLSNHKNTQAGRQTATEILSVSRRMAPARACCYDSKGGARGNRGRTFFLSDPVAHFSPWPLETQVEKRSAIFFLFCKRA